MRKNMIAFLAAVLAISFSFSGCRGGVNVANSNLNELSFKVYQPMFSKTAQGTMAQEVWLDKMQKYLGVKLNIEWEEIPFADYLQKQKVYLAAADFADIFMCQGIDVVNQLGEAGLLVNIMDYEEKIPNFKSYLEGKWQFEKVSVSEGAVYGFADGAKSTNTGNQAVEVARFDVFSKNNIKLPSDVTEYYEAAKKLKELYPNTYPITSFGAPENFVETFLKINHTSHTLYYNGNKFVYPVIEEQEKFKQTIIYLNKLYKENLLDPEFLTQNTDQTMQKMLTGKSFLVPNFMGIRLNQYINNNKEYSVNWGVIPELKNERGEIPWKQSSNMIGKNLDNWINTVISKKTKNPEMLVKLMDYQYSEEMFELANWGIEGVTFTKNSDGTRTYSDEVKNAENPQLKLAEYGVNQSMSIRSGVQFMPQDKDAAIQLLSPVPVYKNGRIEKDNFWKFTSDIYGEASVCPNDFPPPVKFSYDEKDDLNKIKSSLDTYVKENMIKFVIGQKAMEEWDDFINDLESAGNFRKLVEAYNGKMSGLR